MVGRIGFLYIAGKRIPKFWQNELDKMDEKLELMRIRAQAQSAGDKLRDLLLEKLDEGCGPYERVFFAIDACRTNLQTGLNYSQ